MKQFGHYQIIAELGRGGMGVVLKAHEQSLNRYVAIKVLSQQLANDEAVRERFIREARAVAALNHPNVVQVYFAGEHDGQPFFSMEFVQGQALSEYLKQHAPLSPKEAAEILLQAAKGLAAAHEKGIVHRDIKPANLMMTQDGTIKLTDFGIAMAEDQGQKLTSTGEFVGTPGYLSPEVCIGAEVDARTDIFSLGIVYFEMLAGTPPFTNPSPLGLLREVVEAQIPDIGEINSEVDAVTREVLEGMLQKRPEDRFESCSEIIEKLQTGIQQGAFAENRPLPNRDATRIWSDETTDATRASATQATAEQGPPQPPAAPTPAATTAASAVPPAPQTAANQPEAEPPVTRASAQFATAKQPSSKGVWLVAALIVLFAGASIAAIRFAPQYLPAPVQKLAGMLGWGGQNQQAISKASSSDTGENILSEQQNRPTLQQTTPAAAMPTELEPQPVNQARIEKMDSPAQQTHPVSAQSANLPTSADVSKLVSAVEQVKTAALNTTAASLNTAEKKVSATAPLKTRPKQDPMARARKDSLARLATGKAHAALLLAGEPAVLDALQSPLMKLLQEQGVELVDNSLLDGAAPWLKNDHWDLQGLQRKALLSGVELVVLVTSRYLGQETLNYYGQSSELISSNVEIKVVRMPDLHMVVPGRRFQVRYTALNSDYQVKEAFADVADELSHSLHQALGQAQKGS